MIVGRFDVSFNFILSSQLNLAEVLTFLDHHFKLFSRGKHHISKFAVVQQERHTIYGIIIKAFLYCIFHHPATPFSYRHDDLFICIKSTFTFFLFEIPVIAKHCQQRSMNDLACCGIFREGRIDPVEECVEPTQPDRVHSFALRYRVVFEQFGKKDLNRRRGTARLLSFSSSIYPLEKAFRSAKATVS